MKLRDDPRLYYKGVPSWPPTWIWRRGNKHTTAKGEVGILKAVLLSNIEPSPRCFLTMQHDGQEFLGILLFEDLVFCRQIYTELIKHLGEPIQQIGEIDLGHIV